MESDDDEIVMVSSEVEHQTLDLAVTGSTPVPVPNSRRKTDVNADTGVTKSPREAGVREIRYQCAGRTWLGNSARTC